MLKGKRILIFVGIVLLAGFYGYRLYQVNKDFVIKPETKVYNIGQSVITGELATTILGYGEYPAMNGRSAEEGYVYIAFDVSLKNVGKQSIQYLIDDYVLYKKFDTYILDFDVHRQLKKNGNFIKKEIDPGEIVAGKLVFQIPKYSNDLQFKYPARENEREHFQFNKETIIHLN